MFQILENKYPEYEDIIARVAHSLITDNDFINFSKLVGEIYGLGYTRAVDDHKEQLKKLGDFTVSITKKTLDGNPK